MKSQVLNLLFKILGVGQMYYKIQNIFRFKKNDYDVHAICCVTAPEGSETAPPN